MYVCCFSSLSCLPFAACMRWRERTAYVRNFECCSCTTQCRWSLSHVRVRAIYSKHASFSVCVCACVFIFAPLERNDFVVISQKMLRIFECAKRNDKHLQNTTHTFDSVKMHSKPIAAGKKTVNGSIYGFEAMWFFAVTLISVFFWMMIQIETFLLFLQLKTQMACWYQSTKWVS